MTQYRYICRKLRSAIAMLVISSILLASSTYAWVLLSTAPEVSNVDVVLGGNQALEIALATKEHLTELKANEMYDNGKWSGLHSNNVHINNTKWGNVVDLGDDSYGLQYITLKPVVLNLLDNAIRKNPISTPEYGADGRIGLMNTSSTYATFNVASGIFDAADASDYGVRVIGRTADSDLTGRILEKREQVLEAYSALYASFGKLTAEVYLFQLEEAEDYTLEKMQEISLALIAFEDIFLDLTDLVNTAFPDALSEEYDQECYQGVLDTISTAKELLKNMEKKNQEEPEEASEEAPTETTNGVTLDDVKSILDVFFVDPVFYYKTYVYDETLKKEVVKWEEITNYQAQIGEIYQYLTIKGKFGKTGFYDDLYHLVGDELYSNTDGLSVFDTAQTLNYRYSAFCYSIGDYYDYGRLGDAALYANSSNFSRSLYHINVVHNAEYNAYVAKLNQIMQEDYLAFLDFSVLHAGYAEGNSEEQYYADEWIGECQNIDSEGTGMLGRLSGIYTTLSEMIAYFDSSLSAIGNSDMLFLTSEVRKQLEDTRASVSTLMAEVSEKYYKLREEVYGYKYDEDGKLVLRAKVYLGNDPEYPAYYQKDYDTMVSLWSSYLDLDDVTINDIPVFSFYENLEDYLIQEEPEEGKVEDPDKIDYMVSFGGDSIFEQALAIVNDPVMVACVSGYDGILHDVDEARANESYKMFDIPVTWEEEWEDWTIPEIPAEDKVAVQVAYDPTYQVYPFYSWTRQLEYEHETDREYVYHIVNSYACRYEDAAESAYQSVTVSDELLEAVKNQILYEITGEYQTKGYTEEQISDMVESLASSVSTLNTYQKYFNELLKLVAAGDGTTRAQYEAFMAAETIDEKLSVLNMAEGDSMYDTYYQVKNALNALEAAATEMKALKPQKAEVKDETEATETTEATEATEATGEATEPTEETLEGLIIAEDVAPALDLLVSLADVQVNSKTIAEFKTHIADSANLSKVSSVSVVVPSGPFAVVQGVCGYGSQYAVQTSTSKLTKEGPELGTDLRIVGKPNQYSPGTSAWNGLAEAPTDGESTDANRTADYLLNETYCFCVDMLFRTSQSGGVLQLQTDPKYRVFAEDEVEEEDLNPDLMGNGSFIESDNPAIYSDLRFVFADTLTREIYATASADEDGKLRLDNNQEYIVSMARERVEAITVWIYLDGNSVDSVNYSTADLSSLKVNLQFSTNVKLDPAWELLG